MAANMSMNALLGAVVDRLKDQLSLDDSAVGIGYDGRPPAFTGEEWFQVHPGRVYNDKRIGRESLDEYFDVTVTLTRRTGYTPQDRIGSAVMAEQTQGLYTRADAVKVAIHVKDEVLDFAGGSLVDHTWTGGKDYSIPDTAEGFIEKLAFDDYSVPEPKGPEWFWATGKGGYQNSPPAGIAIEIRFCDARRVQTIESMS